MIATWAVFTCVGIALVAGVMVGYGAAFLRYRNRVDATVDRQLDLLRAKRQEVMVKEGLNAWPFDRLDEEPSRIGHVDLDGPLDDQAR